MNGSENGSSVAVERQTRTAPPHKSRIDWSAIDRQVLERLDIAREAELLGVKFTSAEANEAGWRECRAIDRPDEKPSAAVNVASTNGLLGRYTDLASRDQSNSRSISFFELASRLQPSRYPDWKSARNEFANTTGVELPTRGNHNHHAGGKEATGLRATMERQLEFRADAVAPTAAVMWAKHKPGVLWSTALRAGLEAAVWIGKFDVVAFPAFSPVDWEKPVAVIIYRRDGEEFPAVGNLKARKVHQLKGSSDGLCIVGTPEELAAASFVWKCEGLTDAICLAAHLRAGHIAVTNVSGATSFAKVLVQAFAGKRVNIVHDADKAGEAGGAKVAAMLNTMAAEVRRVKLPYEVTDDHGKDLRDFFNEGHAMEELLSLADSAQPDKSEPEPLPAIRNFDREVIDEKENTTPLPMQKVLTLISDATENWPQQANGGLFVPGRRNSASGVSWLKKTASLFGWLANHCGSVSWKKGGEMVTQEQVFEEVRRTADHYDAIELFPHEPPLAGHYYAYESVEPGDGTALAKLLERFEPETPIDRDLIQAAFMTPLWGGRGGARPCFVVTSDHGRGVGKTKVAEMVGRLYGGTMDFSAADKIKEMKERLLSDGALTKRVALLDNVKSLRFSWAELESLITAPDISGKRMYLGEAARPNTITWFITLNGACLSTDMAQRSIIIKLGVPTRAQTWEEETVRFIDENRWAIIADLVAALREEAHPPRHVSRWAMWEKDILSRLPEPNDAQQLILERQKCYDVEHEEVEMLEEFFAGQLVGLAYNVAKDKILVPSEFAARWYNWSTNEAKSTIGASRIISQFCEQGRTKRLSINKCKTYGRGFVWTGPDASVGDSLWTNLRERMRERAKEKEKDG